MPKVALVLPSFCPTIEITRFAQRCWRQLFHSTPHDLFDLHLIEQGPMVFGTGMYFTEPLGYARAVNQGLGVADRRNDTEYVCILNNDCFVPQGWLETMLEEFAKDPDMGLLSPFDQDTANELPNLARIHPAIKLSVNGLYYNWHWWSCVLMKRIPGFRLDAEKLNFRYHDQDANIRLHQMGKAICRTPKVVVEHVNAATYREMHKEAEESEERADMMRRYGVPGFEDYVLREQQERSARAGEYRHDTAHSQKPLFSILHTSARPHKWREIYDAWIKAAVHPEQVEYVLCVDWRWGFEPHPDFAGPATYVLCVDWRWGFKPHPDFAGPATYQNDRAGLNIFQVNQGRRCYVDGVNTAAKASSGRILIVNADDQYPCEEWDERLVSKLERMTGNAYGPDPAKWPDGVFSNTRTLWPSEFVIEVSTGTPDEHARGIMVMPILSRARYERLGYVFYPEYESMFADNDFCEHARQDGVVIDARHLMFPHRHPLFDKAVLPDKVYQAQNRPEAWALGQRILEARRRSHFLAPSHVLPGDPQPETRQPKHITILLPGERFERSWVASLLALCFELTGKGYTVGTMLAYTTNVYMTRMELAQMVLESERKPDYLLWLDDDNTITAEQVEQLIQALEENHADVMAGWCWIWYESQKRMSPSCGLVRSDLRFWPFESPDFINGKQKPREIDWTGFPALLMTREALERAGGPKGFLPVLDDRLQYGMSGEDAGWCKRAKEAGLKLMVHPAVRVPHLKFTQVEPVLPEPVKRYSPKIAVMMRVKNEARWIKRCIESVKELGPVFVLDDWSTDETPQIAMNAGATKVLRSPFRDEPLNEARDKEYLLKAVMEFADPQPDWIFCIDGDEELEPGGIEKIRQAIASGKSDCYSVKFLYLWDREDQVRVDGVYSNLTRPSLFRAGQGLGFESSYKGMGLHVNFGLHVSNAPKLRAVESQPLDVYLLHYGYMLREDRLRKFGWYNQIDPDNEIEDFYRHMAQGDVVNIPADAKLKHAGPLMLVPISTLLKTPQGRKENERQSETEENSQPPGAGREARALKLNLGCCDNRLAGYVGVDVCDGPAVDVVVDLNEYRWPWEDSSVSEVLAADVIEHLRDKTHTMNELWRVLEPGGIVKIVVPTTDGPGAFQDPTHVSFWNRNSFKYYEDGNPYRERFRKSYGIEARFQIREEQTREIESQDGPKLYIVLEAVKHPSAKAAD